MNDTHSDDERTMHKKRKRRQMTIMTNQMNLNHDRENSYESDMKMWPYMNNKQSQNIISKTKKLG